MPNRSFRRCRVLSALCCALLTGCSGSSSNGSSEVNPNSDQVHLLRIEQGKLVDVYGLRTIGGAQVIELFQTDVLVGIDIPDERDATSNKSDAEIRFDFISPNPDSLQPRLLITREIGSEDFRTAFAELDQNVRTVSPTKFGNNAGKAPYPVVPRNAALRLTFSGDLRITDEHFYTRDASGKVQGVRNAEAVQLLEIVGDPDDNDHSGDFKVIDTRLVTRGNQILVDPVLLGSEGLIYGSRNTASGMPESPDQRGANIRLALALEGPLAIPVLAADRTGSLSGRNNQATLSIVRDFRSGNSLDNSPELARGFLRDPTPPRLVGAMRMFIEQVEPVNERVKLLTIFKNDFSHEIDRGDLLRVFTGSTSIPLASLEVLQDPLDDLGKPEVQRVRVLVRPVLGPNGEDLLESIDPSNDPAFPRTAGTARNAFLRRFAPRAVLVAEYTARRTHPDPNGPAFYGDDPRNFISFSPTPLPADSGQFIPNEFVSPFAGAIVRFSKPIDMSTVIALDTAFFATRDLLDATGIDAFVTDRKIDPTTFREEKFRTPHLITSRVFDENGSQTAVRIQPTLGFYLDDAMREAAEQDKTLPFDQRRYRYFLHVVGGIAGIQDIAGNPLDLQAESLPGLSIVDSVVIPFSLDTRDLPASTRPRFDNNLVAYVARRQEHPDEDERPNYYQDAEIVPVGSNPPAASFPSFDVFGPMSYPGDGTMVARSGTRISKHVDNVNQLPPPAQSDPLRWCPLEASSGYGSNEQVVSASTTAMFGQPIQNPLNPYGCRLQTVWRDVDMSLSRTDPSDFNLDVERLYWAPFTGSPIYYDEFDRVSLFLGHCEFRPEACIHSGSAFPSMQNSGLFPVFAANYVHNLRGPGQVGEQPQPHPAFVDKTLPIAATDAVLDPTGTYRYLPLPPFDDATQSSGLKNPLFVWRDEQVHVTGGMNGLRPDEMTPYPYLLSPFMGGQGNRVIGDPNSIEFVLGRWYNGNNVNLASGDQDTVTHGLVGTIALPLLADFWVYPDSSELPANDPFIASGSNGWQISLAATSQRWPYFRAYSAGRGGASPIPVGPSHPNWAQAAGGYTPTGATTNPRDNSVYWVKADFLKRTSVVTAGFIDLLNPHRMPVENGVPKYDRRLGPFDSVAQGMLPTYSVEMEPGTNELPAGTSVVTEFRGASQLGVPNANWPRTGANPTNVDNFPLDPLKAGDASLRHWDNRNGRNHWSYLYNKTVTTYTQDPNKLTDKAFLSPFGAPGEGFDGSAVRYVNWRFIMTNNLEANPPVSPFIESFSLSYRFN